MTSSSSRANVLLSAAYLMPVRGKTVTAHSTRDTVFRLLEETRNRRGDNERSMIVDVSATTWNWDTYAIVGGKPSPVAVTFNDKEELSKFLPLKDDGKTAKEGILLPQSSGEKIWMPKGAMLRETKKQEDGNMEFIFEAPVDPNDDRLEHWEQEVVGKKHLEKWRAKLVWNSMRSMMRFYELDRIICWDLSWGIWEAVRDQVGGVCDDGFPRMKFVNSDDDDDGKHEKFPSSVDTDDDDAKKEARETIYRCCRPVSPATLAKTLASVSGYYLVGGNTYTMSLFHNMWDRQSLQNGLEFGHMQLLRNQLKEGKLFYLGHSAGLIMSGPNILTATFKGIDAFSIVTQPYNAPFMRLPPCETPETFFAKEKNDLYLARTKMLENMSRHGGWFGYRAVEAMAFPHYDARPRFASFPQSAETYLRATNEKGQFAQDKASLLVGNRDEGERYEPTEVTKLRKETNAASLPCYPIANGHAILMECGGLQVEDALSPEEEGSGILHWDTYMPYVPNKNWDHYDQGRKKFATGSFTGDKDTLAGDRSSEEYNGIRIFSRLEALGLPNPGATEEGASGKLFRTK